jgi:DNA-binding transcriptional MerR regulator
MADEQLRIGDLATTTATKVETIRYYERIGLLPTPRRTSGNYRAYSRRHLERLSFIRHARELGFPIEAVRDLLRLADDPERPSATMPTGSPAPTWPMSSAASNGLSRFGPSSSACSPGATGAGSPIAG